MFGGGCNAGTGASSSAEYLQSPRDKEPQYAFHCEGSDLSVRPGEVLPIAERYVELALAFGVVFFLSDPKGDLLTASGKNRTLEIFQQYQFIIEDKPTQHG
ncbi:hypothetical protein AV530_016490 [Patagioenas fasciata monilis]|uniref:Uncharacterized protein n=1 Tax=Patagioenas fasciata monilis TaxID=372326 RepID=A0A1V4J2A7_PATFA|nr:hypothetical protein AV530_016490 [Patagioenas fasciata monilis]